MEEKTFGDFLRERHEEVSSWPWSGETSKKKMKKIKTKGKKVKY